MATQEQDILKFFHLISNSELYTNKYIEKSIGELLDGGINPFVIYNINGKKYHGLTEAIVSNDGRIIDLFFAYAINKKFKVDLSGSIVRNDKHSTNTNILQYAKIRCDNKTFSKFLSHAQYEHEKYRTKAPAELLNKTIIYDLDGKEALRTNILSELAFGIYAWSILKNLHIDTTIHQNAKEREGIVKYMQAWSRYHEDKIDSLASGANIPTVPEYEGEINLVWDYNWKAIKDLIEKKLADINGETSREYVCFNEMAASILFIDGIKNQEKQISGWNKIVKLQILGHSHIKENKMSDINIGISSDTSEASNSSDSDNANEPPSFEPTAVFTLKNSFGKLERNFNIKMSFKSLGIITEAAYEAQEAKKIARHSSLDALTTKQQNSVEGMHEATVEALKELSGGSVDVIDFYNNLKTFITHELMTVAVEKRRYIINNNSSIGMPVHALKMASGVADTAISIASSGAIPIGPVSLITMPLSSYLARFADQEYNSVFNVMVGEVNAHEKTAIRLAGTISANMKEDIIDAAGSNNQKDFERLLKMSQDHVKKALCSIGKNTKSGESPLSSVVKSGIVHYSAMKQKRGGCLPRPR